MAWTAPATFTNVMLTAAVLNAQDSANLAALRNANDAYVKLFLDSNPSIPNNTNTKVSWTDAAFNIGGIWSVGNPTRLVAPVTGKYRVYINLEWRSNSAALRNCSLLRNSPALQIDLQSQGAAGGKSNLSCQVDVLITATNYVELQVFQSSGGALTLHGGSIDRTRIAMRLLGT